MTHSLVIGGTLFLGRALVRRLLARGDQVTILHRGAEQPFGTAVHEIHCDRNDIPAVRAALSGQDFDLVFDNVYDWERGTPAEAVTAAAEAAGPSLRRYVFTSSVAVYADGFDRSEGDPIAPADDPDPYRRNKAESERALFHLHQTSGVPCVALRPPFIYGPENPFYREAFFWDRILAGRPIIVPGDGSRLMQFIHADDLAQAAIIASETDSAAGRAFNIAEPEPISQADWVRRLAEAAGKRADLVQVPREKLLALGGKLFEPPYYFGQYLDLPPITQDTDRAQKDLRFQPRAHQAGLAETFAWYRQHQPFGEPDFSWEDEVLSSA